MWMGFDSLINFFSGLGIPGRDKRTGTQFSFTPLTEAELESMYRDSWLAGKIVDCPADDSTREWRNWQAKPNQIENLEAIEKAFDVRRKMRDAMVLARLFGGSALVMGVDGQGDATQFLDVEKVKKGQLKFLHVAAPKALGTGPIITDVMNPFYGYPEYFSRNIGGTVGRPAVSASPLPTSELIRTEPSRSGDIGDMYRIHPSRVILFRGKGLPDPTIWSSGGPWGDSILQRINESINDASSIFANAAVLVNEAKFDVVKIPGLNQKIINEEYQKKLTARFMYANVSKSTINTIVLDKDEEWARISQDFGALPEMMRMFTLIVSGAADIPVTRLLGQSPAGLSATGESDIRNYYDRVASDQENDLTPTINRLDEVLIRTALGDRDPSIYYEWTPLWQMSEEEKADVALKKAQTFKIDHDAGLIDPEALRIGRQSQLIEDGVYPGLEQALEEQQLLELESMKTPEEQDQEALQSGDPSLPPVSPGAATAASNVINLAKRKAGGVSDLSPFDDAMMWDPGEHPRNASGPGGGQFASKGGSSKELTEEEKIALVARMTPQQMVAEWKKQTGSTKDPTEQDLAEFFGLSSNPAGNIDDYRSYDDGEGSAEDASDEIEALADTQAVSPEFKKALESYSGGQEGSDTTAETVNHTLRHGSAGKTAEKAGKAELEALKTRKRELDKKIIAGEDLTEAESKEYSGITSKMSGGGPGSKDKTLIKKLDAGFKSASLPASMVTFRGVKSRAWDKLKGLKAGDEFLDSGYMSTSVRLSVADEFRQGVEKGDEAGGMLQLLLPKGAPAVILGSKLSEFPGEAEVLVNRGTKFRVKSVKDGLIQLEIQ
jgi:phage-related protein (TIGR01555 family)